MMEKLLSASDTAVVVTHHHEYLELFDRVELYSNRINVKNHDKMVLDEL